MVGHKRMDQLDELYALHWACLQFEHGVRQQGRKWRVYKPSSFVYAYFTFNTLYSVNWAASIEQGVLVEWQAEVNPKTGKESHPSESKKIRKMVQFCYKALGSSAPDVFHRHLQKHMSEIAAPEDKLKDIISDSRTREHFERFQKKFSGIINRRLGSAAKHRDALYDLLYFVYLVRNNIFHGSKTTIQMMDEDQRARLVIYTAILIAANALLFEAMEQLGLWWPQY